jgi:sterol desaturase/sphingolipid hydroxylase (fatty acid hydroxylase superfamily)
MAFAVSPSAARLIHAVLPALIVAFGIVSCPEGPEAYLSAFASLFVAIASSILLGAGLYEVGWAAVGCARLQPHKEGVPKQYAAEAFETTRASWMFASLAAFPRARFLAGKPTAVLFTLAEVQPDAPDAVWLYVLKLVAVTWLVDAYMYWKHRMLHSRPLWAFHADHHSFHDPSPFASFAVAPVEAFLTFWPVTLLSLREAPILGQAYALWVCGFVLLNLYLHAGRAHWLPESILTPLGLNTSLFHNVHHEKTVQNFGELMYVWDALLGTGAHPEARPWEARGRAAAARGKAK